MKQKNVAKWIVGVGSITSIAAFLGLTQEKADQSTEQVASDNMLVKQTALNEKSDKALATEVKQKREEWISSLDWSEDSWDVNVEREKTIITPKSSNDQIQNKSSQNQRKTEVRTRRS